MNPVSAHQIWDAAEADDRMNRDYMLSWAHAVSCWRLYSLSDLKHAFCMDLDFFQWHSFRPELNKRTNEGKSCPLSSWLKASGNFPCILTVNTQNAKSLVWCYRPTMWCWLSGAPEQNTDILVWIQDFWLTFKLQTGLERVNNNFPAALQQILLGNICR